MQQTNSELQMNTESCPRGWDTEARRHATDLGGADTARFLERASSARPSFRHLPPPSPSWLRPCTWDDTTEIPEQEPLVSESDLTIAMPPPEQLVRWLPYCVWWLPNISARTMLNIARMNFALEFRMRMVQVEDGGIRWQGGARWKADKNPSARRPLSVGGSSAGAALGHDSYRSPRKLTGEMAGLIPRTWGVNLTWGHVLEPFVGQQFEKTYCSRILEVGSLPGRIREQRVSPDGLAVVCMLQKGVLVPRVALLEFKAPASRRLKKSVPKHYLDQVLMGLDTVREAHFGLYMEAAFRACALDDCHFGNGEFSRRFHRAKNQPECVFPHSCGVVWMARVRCHPRSPADLSNVPPEVLRCVPCIHDLDNWEHVGTCVRNTGRAVTATIVEGCQLLDCGTLSYDAFVTLMWLIQNNFVRVWTGTLVTRRVLAELTRESGAQGAPDGKRGSAELRELWRAEFGYFEELCAQKDWLPFAMLPLKCIDLGTHIVEPQHGFIDENAEAFRRVVHTAEAARELVLQGRAVEAQAVVDAEFGGEPVDPTESELSSQVEAEIMAMFS